MGVPECYGKPDGRCLVWDCNITIACVKKRKEIAKTIRYGEDERVKKSKLVCLLSNNL